MELFSLKSSSNLFKSKVAKKLKLPRLKFPFKKIYGTSLKLLWMEEWLTSHKENLMKLARKSFKEYLSQVLISNFRAKLAS